LSDEHVVHHHEGERNARPPPPRKGSSASPRLARVDERVLGKGAAAAAHHAIARLNEVTPSPTLATSAAPSFPAASRVRPFHGVPDDQLAAIQARRMHAQQDLPAPGAGSGTSRNSSAVFPESGLSQYDFISSPRVAFRADTRRR